MALSDGVSWATEHWDPERLQVACPRVRTSGGQRCTRGRQPRYTQCSHLRIPQCSHLCRAGRPLQQGLHVNDDGAFTRFGGHRRSPGATCADSVQPPALSLSTHIPRGGSQLELTRRHLESGVSAAPCLVYSAMAHFAPILTIAAHRACTVALHPPRPATTCQSCHVTGDSGWAGLARMTAPMRKGMTAA